LETNSTSSICSKPVEDPVQLEMGDYQEELWFSHFFLSNFRYNE
jgi:hypothetical protein